MMCSGVLAVFYQGGREPYMVFPPPPPPVHETVQGCRQVFKAGKVGLSIMDLQ